MNDRNQCGSQDLGSEGVGISAGRIGDGGGAIWQRQRSREELDV